MLNIQIEAVYTPSMSSRIIMLPWLPNSAIYTDVRYYNFMQVHSTCASCPCNIILCIQGPGKCWCSVFEFNLLVALAVHSCSVLCI